MRRWLGLMDDGTILAGVLIVTVCIGGVFLFEMADTPVESVALDFFGPAVMVASGHGFITPVASTIPELANFLNQKRMDFDPKCLPANFLTFPNDQFQSNHFYLLEATGLLWRVFGINWHVLKLLALILFCAMAGVVYGLFRLGMSRIVSAMGTLLTMTAPLTLSTLPSVRDFGKAPFILGALLILGYLVTRPVTPRRLLGAALGLGLVIGFGQGFRQDVFICLIPSVLIIAFFARGLERLSAVQRLLAVVLLVASYAVVAWPCRGPTSDEGTLMFHNVMMGLAPECSDQLGIGRSSYELEYLCNDNFAHATRSSYARRVKGNTNVILYMTIEASRVAKDYVRDLVKLFPSDFMTRGYAALRFALGGNALCRTPFAAPQDQLLGRMTALHAPVAACMNAIGVVAAAIVLLGISRKDLRLAVAVLFLLLYFGSYGAMLFQLRHCFHVCFVQFWFAGLLLDFGLRSIHNCRWRIVSWQDVETRRMAAFAVFAAVALLLPLAGLRAYQYVRVGTWIEAFRTAKLERVEVEQRDLDGWPLFRPAGLVEPWPAHTLSREEGPKGALRAAPGTGSASFDAHEMDPAAAYWVVALAGNTTRCPVAVRFESERLSNDFSRILYIQPGGTDVQAETLFFFPVYEFPASVTLGQSRFVGVALPPERAAEFRGLYRVADLSNFSFLPVLSLPKDRSLFQRYQTLGCRK